MSREEEGYISQQRTEAREFHRPPSTVELPDPDCRRIISPTAQSSVRENVMFSVYTLGTFYLQQEAFLFVEHR